LPRADINILLRSVSIAEAAASGKIGIIGTHEAFSRVVHEAKLEPLLIEETLGQRTAQRVGRQRALLRKLQLRKQVLEQGNATKI